MQVNVKMDAEESNRLERVSRYYGLNGPTTLRMLLKREDDVLEQEKKSGVTRSLKRHPKFAKAFATDEIETAKKRARK